MVKKSTRISRFIGAVGDQPVIVGLDVHKKAYSVALFSSADGQVESYTCPSEEDGLAHQLLGFGCRVCPSSYYLRQIAL